VSRSGGHGDGFDLDELMGQPSAVTPGSVLGAS
jgi:hypothetical protein